MAHRIKKMKLYYLIIAIFLFSDCRKDCIYPSDCQLADLKDFYGRWRIFEYQLTATNGVKENIQSFAFMELNWTNDESKLYKYNIDQYTIWDSIVYYNMWLDCNKNEINFQQEGLPQFPGVVFDTLTYDIVSLNHNEMVLKKYYKFLDFNNGSSIPDTIERWYTYNYFRK